MAVVVAVAVAAAVVVGVVAVAAAAAAAACGRGGVLRRRARCVWFSAHKATHRGGSGDGCGHFCVWWEVGLG